LTHLADFSGNQIQIFLLVKRLKKTIKFLAKERTHDGCQLMTGATAQLCMDFSLSTKENYSEIPREILGNGMINELH
jgi:hypothetical protein